MALFVPVAALLKRPFSLWIILTTMELGSEPLLDRGRRFIGMWLGKDFPGTNIDSFATTVTSRVGHVPVLHIFSKSLRLIRPLWLVAS